MIKNHFKIAWRNLIKNKVYSIINIFGLAIGLASCLLIILYVLDELSYDHYNVNADRIYRINSDIQMGGGDLQITQTSDMMGELLKKDYPQVEEYTRIYSNEGPKLIKKGKEFINEQKIAYIDSTFFKVFSLPAIYGDPNEALNEPNSVVITESTAKKYFGTSDALGKTVEIKSGNTTIPFSVNAVIKDIPNNSHFNFNFMLSMKNANYQWGQLVSHNFHTYLLLKRGTDYRAFEKNFEIYKTKYVFPEAQKFIDMKNIEAWEASGNKLDYSLMPLKKIHLYSNYSYELSPPGNIQYVYIFSIVALFILLLACINFMNLSTARSAHRAKEVGIRKVLGTERKTLVLQFLMESIITACIALVIALALVLLVMPIFNTVAGKSLTMAYLFNIKLLSMLLILPFVVGLLAGSYPALFLSKFKPITALKGTINSGYKKSSLRNLLVVFQFSTSVILISATIIVYKQLHYIQTTELGYNKDQVLIINDAHALNTKVEAFKNEALGMNGVSSGTISSFLPVSQSPRHSSTYSTKSVMDANSSIQLQSWQIDYDYLKTMGMEIVKGRNFSKDYATDSTAVLITETTAKLLGYEDPINKTIYAPSETNYFDAMIPLNIIGVVKDFHYESLVQNIGPVCLRLGHSRGAVSFKINAGSTSSLINQIENKWKSMTVDIPFSYRFLDDSFNEMYQNEQRIGSLSIMFALLAIVIACLGLFGLATYMAEQRTKEIGIRKVLGASISNIVTMISKDFLMLVAIACIIAFPVAWYTMNKWLANYSYRIDIEWWIFLVSGVTTFVIALLTVSLQSTKAATSNPIKSLRTE